MPHFQPCRCPACSSALLQIPALRDANANQGSYLTDVRGERVVILQVAWFE